MFTTEFLIDDMAVDQLDLDRFSLNQFTSCYYIPVEIVKLKFNYM